MTDFILQSTGTDNGFVAKFTDRIGRRPRPVSSSAWRWVDVVPDPALEALAFDFQTDAAFVPSKRSLTDYRLVVMDMDSTLITIECIDEIADQIGVKSQVASITEAAMRGELDFASALRRRVALLEGVPEESLQKVYDQRLQLSPGAESMLSSMRTAGLKTLLVSGGFTFFTDRLKARLNLDFTVANHLEVRGGRLTGQVLGAIIDAERKAVELRETCQRIGCDVRQSIAMGDGANDLRMLAAAGVGIAYHAKPIVRQQATHSIQFCGLDAVIPLFS